MAEINATPSDIPAGDISDPHPHNLEVGVPISSLHSNPLKQSPSQSTSEVNQNNLEEKQ